MYAGADTDTSTYIDTVTDMDAVTDMDTVTDMDMDMDTDMDIYICGHDDGHGHGHRQPDANVCDITTLEVPKFA